MDGFDIKVSNIIAFFLGCVITFTLIAIIAKANCEPCVRCGKQCSDSSIYCNRCGQQLRIIDKQKEK